MATPLRSLAAVCSGTLVAFLAFVFAPVVVLFVVGEFSATYVNTHADLVFSLTYAVGTIVVATVAGGAVGLLAPARPVLHALATAAVIVGISASVASSKGLPRGWQVAGLLCQVALMVAVANLTWHRRFGPARLATRLV